jgi:glycosyltransferase involved in cell wall biosynthesis
VLDRDIKQLFITKAAAKKKYQYLDTKRPVIITISKCVNLKGYDIYLAVCEELYKQGLDATSVFVGASSANDKYIEYMKRIKSLDWDFISIPYMPYKETLELLCASDIFLLTSRLESFCYRIYEARAIGLPVISHQLYVGQDLNIRVADFKNINQMAAMVLDTSLERTPESGMYGMREHIFKYFSLLNAVENRCTPGVFYRHYNNKDVPKTILDERL